MNLVIDASVVMKWLIDEPGSVAAYQLRGHDLVAPSLLRIEAAKGAVEADTAADLFRLLQEAPMDIVDADEVQGAGPDRCGTAHLR